MEFEKKANDTRVMENHGKIMEFNSGKVLGTLKYCSTGILKAPNIVSR